MQQEVVISNQQDTIVGGYLFDPIVPESEVQQNGSVDLLDEVTGGDDADADAEMMEIQITMGAEAEVAENLKKSECGIVGRDEGETSSTFFDLHKDGRTGMNTGYVTPDVRCNYSIPNQLQLSNHQL